MGEFTKASLSFNAVKDLTFKIWGEKGLLQVFQKSASTFLFKFVDVASKADVLSRGTIFLFNRPLVLRDWSTTVGAKPVTSIPLWIKLNNLPDCYWTREGLSSVSSVIGNPICADKLTQKLEILPFARMCVDYKIGDPLPEVIPVTALSPSGEKFVDKVTVEYVHKPLICSGCKQLGHPVTACPITKRVWVQKKVLTAEQDKVDIAVNVTIDVGNTTLNAESVVNEGSKEPAKEPEKEPENGNGEWTEVTRKKRPLPEGSVNRVDCSPSSASPALPDQFRNVVIDEIAKKKMQRPLDPAPSGKLSKSQRKKLKNSGGGGSSAKPL